MSTLKPMDFRDYLRVGSRDKQSGTRIFQGFCFGDIILSIQAHEGAYCHPRKNLENLHEYSEWEFAIMPLSGDYLRPYREYNYWKPLTEEKNAEIQNLLAEPFSEYLPDDEEGEVIVRIHYPEFLEDGVLHDTPHQDTFSVMDKVGPYVPTQKCQDIFDWFRANFGLITSDSFGRQKQETLGVETEVIVVGPYVSLTKYKESYSLRISPTLPVIHGDHRRGSSFEPAKTRNLTPEERESVLIMNAYYTQRVIDAIAKKEILNAYGPGLEGLPSIEPGDSGKSWEDDWEDE